MNNKERLKTHYNILDHQIYESPITGDIYVNLCPHDLTITKDDDSILYFEKPSSDAMIARIRQDSLGTVTGLDGLVVHKFRTYKPMLYRNIRNEYLDETPFPLQFVYDDVFYIVSFAVQEVLQRSDILAPHAIKFDATNRAIAWQLKGLL